MTGAEKIKHNRKGILRLAKRYGVTGIRLFGSTARGEDTPASDIDLLVEMQTHVDASGLPPYDTAFLQRELEICREWYFGRQLGQSLAEDAQAVDRPSLLRVRGERCCE